MRSNITQELEQLNLIFRVLGTPNESTWPGVSSLPNAKSLSQMTQHSGQQNLSLLKPKLGADGEACTGLKLSPFRLSLAGLLIFHSHTRALHTSHFSQHRLCITRLTLLRRRLPAPHARAGSQQAHHSQGGFAPPLFQGHHTRGRPDDSAACDQPRSRQSKASTPLIVCECGCSSAA